jgi:hypothetical protein
VAGAPPVTGGSRPRPRDPRSLLDRGKLAVAFHRVSGLARPALTPMASGIDAFPFAALSLGARLGVGQMDEVSLREEARTAIRDGKLPSRSPDHTFLGGPGGGAECPVCGLPVRADETEFEIQFAHNVSNSGLDKHHMHIGCFAAWELERQSA